MTTLMVAFIVGLIFMAIMGVVCGHFALKLILSIEKSKADRDRAKQQTNSAPPPTDEQQQA